jgi:hypothetical protein
MDETKAVPPEVLAAVKSALASGRYIACPTRCYACQFGQCPTRRHTWMSEDDITHAGLTVPTGLAGWATLAVGHPCGCWCMRKATP